MQTINITQWDKQNMRTSDLSKLAHFPTKKQAPTYAASVGWFKADIRRIHARLHGYLWIIADFYGNAVPRS